MNILMYNNNNDKNKWSANIRRITNSNINLIEYNKKKELDIIDYNIHVLNYDSINIFEDLENLYNDLGCNTNKIIVCIYSDVRFRLKYHEVRKIKNKIKKYKGIKICNSISDMGLVLNRLNNNHMRCCS